MTDSRSPLWLTKWTEAQVLCNKEVFEVCAYNLCSLSTVNAVSLSTYTRCNVNSM